MNDHQTGVGKMTTRLLFVDDEPFVRDGIRRLLSRRRPEWELSFADSGSAALGVMDAGTFDIVVSDMRMPGMDGAELLTQVRERDPGVVRIILSGQSDREAALRAARVAHQFLAKPFDAPFLEATLDRLCSLRELLSDETLQDLVGGLESLPSAPRLYTQLVELLARQEASLDEVVGVLNQDPAMCVKVLQMVRSAFFGTQLDTVSIEEAVARLGFNVIKSLALTAGVFAAFKQNGEIPGFSAGAEQQHALAVARAAQRILRGGPNADEAFMAGMLHDVGKLVLASKKPEVLRGLLEQARAEGQNLAHVERQVLQTTHAEIGGYLLGIWGLPRSVVEAVANHHAPLRLSHPRFDTLTAVHVADALVRELESSASEAVPGSQGRADGEYLEAVGVADRLPEWRDQVQSLLAPLD
jgi:putative nucleotidyltransferase with HDIG domain